MTWSKLFLSPRGRINRARFWAATLVNYAVFLAFYIPTMSMTDAKADPSGPQIVFLLAAIIVFFLSTYIGIVLGIKRFHDRDKSGTWVLISLIPIVGGIWYIVECGCLHGTPGRNRFGSDPLAPDEDIVRVFGAPERPPLG